MSKKRKQNIWQKVTPAIEAVLIVLCICLGVAIIVLLTDLIKLRPINDKIEAMENYLGVNYQPEKREKKTLIEYTPAYYYKEIEVGIVHVDARCDDVLYSETMKIRSRNINEKSVIDTVRIYFAEYGSIDTLNWTVQVVYSLGDRVTYPIDLKPPCDSLAVDCSILGDGRGHIWR